MPFTPYHLGPGLLVKSIMPRRWFSFAVFAVSQALIDLEPLALHIVGQANRHRFFHSFLGATIVAAVAVIIGRWIYSPLVRRLMRSYNFLPRTGPLEVGPVGLGAAVFSAFVGAYSHVIIDGLIYFKMQPFYPADGGFTIRSLSLADMQNMCLACLAAGAVLLGLRLAIYGLRSRSGSARV